MLQPTKINLCTGVYQPAGGQVPPISVMCQTLVIYGVSSAWIDGVDMAEPVLLPVEYLSGFKRAGTLEDYLAQARHEALGDGFEGIMDLCVTQDHTPTTMVRAIEIMHNEGLPADTALATAVAWGSMIRDLDKADQAGRIAA